MTLRFHRRLEGIAPSPDDEWPAIRKLSVVVGDLDLLIHGDCGEGSLVKAGTLLRWGSRRRSDTPNSGRDYYVISKAVVCYCWRALAFCGGEDGIRTHASRSSQPLKDCVSTDFTTSARSLWRRSSGPVGAPV